MGNENSNPPIDSNNNKKISYAESYRLRYEQKLREEALLRNNKSFANAIKKEAANPDKGGEKGVKGVERGGEKVERGIEREIEKEFRTDKQTPRKIFKVLAYLIPIIILLIILYFNFTPFGYADIKVINVGSLKDTSGVFHLEESPALGARQMFNKEYFRAVDGVVYAIYKPKKILKNTSVSLKLEGSNVSFPVTPSTDFEWEYELNNNIEDWKVYAPDLIYIQFLNGTETFNPNFSKPFAILINYNSTQSETLLKGDLILKQDSKNIILEFMENKTNRQIKYILPDYFLGQEHEILAGYTGKEIYLFVDGEFAGKSLANQTSIKQVKINGSNSLVYSNYDKEIKETIEKDSEGCFIFDGKTRLTLQNSSDKFEVGPFAVYAEWIPEKQDENFQEIIGHYNWEILQESNNVVLSVGRMYSDGPIYTVSYPIDFYFFNKKHSILAIYNPIQEETKAGYAEMYIDGEFAGKTYLENLTIWQDYGDQDLSIGKSNHGAGKYFKGSVCNAKFSYTRIESQGINSINFTSDKDILKIPIFGQGKLNKIELKVKKN
jgi:hypothetical protein